MSFLKSYFKQHDFQLLSSAVSRAYFISRYFEVCRKQSLWKLGAVWAQWGTNTVKVFKNVHAADEGDFWGHFPVRQPYKLHIIESSPTTTDISSRLSSFFFRNSGESWAPAAACRARRSTSEQKVRSVVGCRFCRNVAERETQVLSAGGQQDDMGSPGAVPKPVSGGLWCLRIRLVSHLLCNVMCVCACSLVT